MGADTGLKHAIGYFMSGLTEQINAAFPANVWSGLTYTVTSPGKPWPSSPAGSMYLYVTLVGEREWTVQFFLSQP